jgi:hypothetical protein
MNIVTISERADTAPILTTPDAPVWRDADGVLYRVASGQMDETPAGAWVPESGDPSPVAPAVVAGMDGLTALAVMGLTTIPQEEGLS